MHYFRYKLDHDFGLAPNPFWGTMSLAVCKGDIRINKNLQIGDWIIGTGSKRLKKDKRLIYAMRVEEKLTFDDYWNDPRFQCKKPILNGSLVQMYGDNIYHTDVNSVNIIQEPCAHSNQDMTPNNIHCKRDVKGMFVLLSKHFYYFGNSCPLIPNSMVNLCCTSRNFIYKKDINDDQLKAFTDWIEKNYDIGIHGEPINWKIYNLPELGVYDND